MLPHLGQQLIQHSVRHHGDLLHGVPHQLVLDDKLLGDEGDGGLGDLDAEEGVGEAAPVKLNVLVDGHIHKEAAAIGPGQLDWQSVLLAQFLTIGITGMYTLFMLKLPPNK